MLLTLGLKRNLYFPVFLIFVFSLTHVDFSKMLKGIFVSTLTVTSRDINFRYPDWVTQTEFVHKAKKDFAICA